MNYEKKFLPAEQKQVSETQLDSQMRQTIREFATPEEVLRFDLKQTLAPDSIVERLNRSLQKEPPRPWWKRLFS